MTTMTSVTSQCKLAASVATDVGCLDAATRNQALLAMADALEANHAMILSANAQDVANGQANGLSQALVDRLTLTADRIVDMATGLREIEALPDVIGQVMDGFTRPNGLQISKVRVPLGVIGIIYEARPNVTCDAIGLATKTGNCVVLRGSASAYQSNRAIADVMTTAAASAGYPKDAIQLLEDTTRESVKTFIQMNDYLNLVIPRGGAELIQHVVQHATVPTVETGVGNCHVYVDADADLEKALAIALNAKLHRPSVCNACESMLIHQDIAATFGPKLIGQLIDAGVEVRGCIKTQALHDGVVAAQDSDWSEEYLGLTVAIKVVADVAGAIDHIAQYGSNHSEAIVSENFSAIQRFTQRVDAASVLVNCSTRFTDGGQFGYGAEMGISTQKLHARGPMGIRELTSYKYIVVGDGQVRG